MLHAIHTQETGEQSDHGDSTSGDSHVTTMAVIVKADYFNKTMS